MILGLGLDIAEVCRLKRSWERFGRRFAERILHPDELRSLPSTPDAIALFLASRFAAKEAAVKALGTGFADGIGPRDIQVDKLPSGAPRLVLHGAAAEKMRALGAGRAMLSMTHEKSMAAAVVIFES